MCRWNRNAERRRFQFEGGSGNVILIKAYKPLLRNTPALSQVVHWLNQKPEGLHLLKRVSKLSSCDAV